MGESGEVLYFWRPSAAIFRRQLSGLTAGLVRCRGRLGANRNVSSTEAEFPQLVLERLSMHPQHRCRTCDVAAGFFQTTSDVPAFKLAAVVAKIGSVRNHQTAVHGLVASDWFLWSSGNIDRIQLCAFRHNRGALDSVAQLAHVARP